MSLQNEIAKMSEALSLNVSKTENYIMKNLEKIFEWELVQSKINLQNGIRN